jgi:hypothetical protein
LALKHLTPRWHRHIRDTYRADSLVRLFRTCQLFRAHAVIICLDVTSGRRNKKWQREGEVGKNIRRGGQWEVVGEVTEILFPFGVEGGGGCGRIPFS